MSLGAASAACLGLAASGNLTAPCLAAGSFLLGAVAAGAGCLAACRRIRRERQSAQQFIELLGQLGPHEWSAPLPHGMAAGLTEGHAWRDCLLRLKESLAANSARLADAEHVRAALEVRARRHAAEAERAARILDALPEPVFAVDPYDAVILANPSARRLFGLDGAAAGERALAKIVHCEKLLALLNDTRQRECPATRSEEIEFKDPDGVGHWYLVSASALPADGQGARASTPSNHGALAVLRDVSAQKLTQRHNAEFVSAASHEMRTPLAGIKAYVELLADGDAEDEATREEFLQVINGQADRLQRLIDNLLNLARIEAGVVQVNKQNQPLNEILAEAVRVILPSAENKRITLAQDLSPLYLGVLVDRDLLLQAAINLLSNAVKYTPPDGRVLVRSRLVDRDVQFEVEDTGVGLSADDCRRVFEKFYRVEKDMQMAQGTGLGLPLTRHIIEDMHGGRIWVESRLGKGSVFSVRLSGSGQLGAKQERPE